MNGRNDLPQPRGRITPPSRKMTASTDDALTLDDIPHVLHTAPIQAEKPHLHAPKQASSHSTSSSMSPTTTPAKPHIEALASQRAALGFDDIPVASPQEIEKGKARRERANTSRLGRLFTGKSIANWKDDVKWAIDADKDTDKKSSAAAKPTHAPKAVETTKTIDINISFGDLPKIPRLSRPKNPFSNLPRPTLSPRSKKIALGLVTAGIVLAILYSLPVTQQLLPNSKNEGPAISATSTPSYQTILPADKPASSVAWHRVSPPDRDPVFAYSDTIDDVKIAVSEQPLPNNFKPNVTENIATLAKSYAATDKVTAGDTQLYVGTSGQGPQSVIFTKNGLLVLIKSSSKLPDDAWARYVQSLQNGPHY